MKLKFVLTREEFDKLPAEVRESYTEKDGKFVLALEDVNVAALRESADRLAEFRDNNITLTKSEKALKEQLEAFSGLDPKAAKEAIAKVEALGKKGVKDPDGLEELLKRVTDPLNQKLTLLEDERKADKIRLADSTLREQIGEVAGKKGVKAKAISYVLGKAKDKFEVKDGKVVAKEGFFSPERPTQPLSIEEYLDGLAKEEDFVFEASHGGGSEGGGKKAADIPAGVRRLVNPTPQELGQYADELATGKATIVNA